MVSRIDPTITSYVVRVRRDHQEGHVALNRQAIADKPLHRAESAKTAIAQAAIFYLVIACYGASSPRSARLDVWRNAVYTVLRPTCSTFSRTSCFLSIFGQTMNDISHSAESTVSTRAKGLKLAKANQ